MRLCEYVYVCMFVCMCLCVSVCGMSVCMYGCMYVCIHIYIYYTRNVNPKPSPGGIVSCSPRGEYIRVIPKLPTNNDDGKEDTSSHSYAGFRDDDGNNEWCP